MSKSTYDEVLDLFKRFDTNGDGLLSFDELRELLMTIGLDPREVPVLFRKIDTDRDGKVDCQEFLNWVWDEQSDWQEKLIGSVATAKRALLRIDHTLQSQGARLEDLFRQEALSRPDYMLKQDVIAMMKKYDQMLTDETLESAFTLFDWDGNGGVDLNEFMATFNREVLEAQKAGQEPYAAGGTAGTAGTVRVPVDVPYSAVTGQTLAVDYNGQTYYVTVPSDAVPGGKFEAVLDVSGAAHVSSVPAGRTQEVIVPGNVYAGQWFSVNRGGVERSFMCPAGSGPGDVVSVTF